MVVTRYDSFKEQTIYTLRKYSNYMISHIFASELREYIYDNDIPYVPGNMFYHASKIYNRYVSIRPDHYRNVRIGCYDWKDDPITILLTGKDYLKRISLYDHLMLRLQGKI